MNSALSHVLTAGLALALSAPVLAAEPGTGKISTYYRLLVGRPDPSPGGTSVVVVPGTVVLPGQPTEPAAVDVLKVIDQLLDAYRLSVVEPTGSAIHHHMPGDQAKDVFSVEGGPRIQSTLLAFDEASATYRIALTEGGKLLAEPVIRVQRGGRAIVGGRDGEAAPYVFLLVEPFPPLPDGAQAADATKDITQPKILKKVSPVYPDEARQAGFEGIVLLQATVGTNGRVAGLEVLRGEPMGLSEAAIAAVRQWEWEPARNAKGQAVQVAMTLTIRFALK